MMLGMIFGTFAMATAPAYAEEGMTGVYEAYLEKGISEEVQEAFDKAMENFEGAENYTAIQLVESQVVAGMNYRILCDVKEHDGFAAHKLMVTIYRDLEGNCEVMMEQNVITPMNQITDIEENDFMTKAAFDVASFNWEEQTLTFELYQDALYDMVDITRMEAGSVIEVNGDYVTVEFMEEGEAVRRSEDGTEEKMTTLYINKGEADEHYFVANEGGTWITVLPDDHTGIIKTGELTLPLSATLIFTDITGNPGESVDIPFEELKDYMESIKDSYMSSYGAFNTEIEAENGEIVSIVRTWMP